MATQKVKMHMSFMNGPSLLVLHVERRDEELGGGERAPYHRQHGHRRPHETL